MAFVEPMDRFTVGQFRFPPASFFSHSVYRKKENQTKQELVKRFSCERRWRSENEGTDEEKKA